MSATIKLEKKHYPVLLNELISIISPHYGGTFIDCTFGQGGYSKKILENNLNSIIALDRDPEVKKISDNYKKRYLNRFEFQNIKFSDILKLEKKISNLRGIIFDLGYSINQINDKSKGLSFNSISKLNMQMGLNNISADEVINKMPQKNIEKILKFFGDESKSKIISKIIEKERKNKNLNTKDLVDIINRVKKRQGTKIHNATKSFQALRIFVNEEISELIYGFILKEATDDLSESQPTAGNIAGGLTTIEEKAFGNFQKIGSRQFIDVLEPAEEPTKGKGLYFMDTSSAAAECVTLQAAGGFNIHLFPTGQGNIIGNPIEPVIKLTANPLTAKTMSEHIDVDVSKILSRQMNLDQAGDELIKATLRVANGRLTCAEALGHKEFVMTKLYRSA